MNQSPEELLRIAELHVDALPQDINGISDEEVDRAIDHSLQAIILSAAAVESAVNIQIASPLTYMQPAILRHVYSQFLRLTLRAGIRDKLSALLRANRYPKWSKDFGRRLHALLDARNAIIHSAPTYKEYPARPPYTNGLPPDDSAFRDGLVSAITTSHRSTDALAIARNGCATAKEAVAIIGKMVQKRKRPTAERMALAAVKASGQL